MSDTSSIHLDSRPIKKQIRVLLNLGLEIDVSGLFTNTRTRWTYNEQFRVHCVASKCACICKQNPN